MCLSTISKIFTKENNNTLEGWKIFKIENDKLNFCHAAEYVKYNKLPKIKINKWLKSTTGKAFTRNLSNLDYPTGFHIYLTRAGARRTKNYSYKYDKVSIRKVKVKGLRVLGTENYAKVVVARNIMVLNIKG